MKNLALLPLFAASLAAQQQSPAVKIPREPSVGVEKSHEALPVKNGVPTTTGLPVPAETPRTPRQRTVDPRVAEAAHALRDPFADPDFVAFDEPGDGSVWAAGGNYKVAFDAGAWRFHGQPDAAATSLQPITFRLAGATVGGAALDLGEARRSYVGRHVEYDRGSVVETIDVAGRSVEQAFVFAKLPQRGELLLDVAVTTALAGESGADGVVFSGPFDRVHYTSAVAIDANGARVAAPTTFADGRIHIRVPAEFVASAVLPLRIDPQVSSVVVTTSTNDVGDPDVAWNESSGNWFVTWMRYFGGSDWDCYAQRLSLGASMALVGPVITIDFTGTAWQRPKIANLAAYDRLMVVCQTNDQTNPVMIQGRILDNAGGLLTGQFVVQSSGVDEVHPDIGGDVGGAPTYFTIVWEHNFSTTDHDIYARQVTFDGTLRGTSPIFVQTNTSNQSWPSISKSDGAAPYASQRYTIIYEQTFSATDEDIYGSMLTWDGVFVPVGGQNTFLIDFSGFSDTFPQASSPTLETPAGLRSILCVYERNTNGGDIQATCINQAGNFQASANINVLENNPTRLAWPQFRPSVDSDGFRFVVGYHEVFNNNPTINDLDTRITTVTRSGFSLLAGEAGVTLGFSGNREFNIQVASRYSGSGVYGAAINTVNDRDGISGGGFAIDAYAYHATPTGSFDFRVTGCGTLSIFASGNPVPGDTINFSQSFQPFLSGFVLGSAVNTPIGICPGCTLGVDGFLSIGSTYSFTVPFNVSVVGAGFSAQGFVFQPTGAPCIDQIQLSDTIDVTIG
jgi:hypothetical protein